MRSPPECSEVSASSYSCSDFWLSPTVAAIAGVAPGAWDLSPRMVCVCGGRERLLQWSRARLDLGLDTTAKVLDGLHEEDRKAGVLSLAASPSWPLLPWWPSGGAVPACRNLGARAGHRSPVARVAAAAISTALSSAVGASSAVAVSTVCFLSGVLAAAAGFILLWGKPFLEIYWRDVWMWLALGSIGLILLPAAAIEVILALRNRDDSEAPQPPPESSG